LKRRKRILPKYWIPEEKDALFRAIEDPRDRAIFRLAYHHGLRVSEIGMIQVKDWRQGASLDVDRLFLRRLKEWIGGQSLLVNDHDRPACLVADARPPRPGRSSRPGTTSQSRVAGSTS
jgi:integrase